ncbi:metallohydrolase [Algiphilus sp.]|uniref:metallohydrolase n=1 Tax=Algiphilus sp. TaxID=1872431 RepID=UPI0032F07977
MESSVTFFPVGNGDMTLVKLADADKTALLIDCNIRQSADDPDHTDCDVGSDLRSRISVDAAGRPCIDAFLLSHPDEDHCRGLERHFWLGPIGDYPDDAKAQKDKRIVIREILSSPIVFRRARKNHALCTDAKAFNKEAKRRVQAYRQYGSSLKSGDRIRILGEDENGKTDDLQGILTKQGEIFYGLNNQAQEYFSAALLAPLRTDDDGAEEQTSKNNSSVIIRISIRNNHASEFPAYFLTGGDAGVYIWERVWDQYSPSELEYNLLQAPHHCSWRSLSYDSWSMCGEKAALSEKARDALGQALSGAMIVSSSKPISDDDADPPCIRAKREFKAITQDCNGVFRCTGEHPSKVKPSPLVLRWTGAQFVAISAATAAASSAASAPPRAG